MTRRSSSIALTAPLQFRDSSFTLPVVKDGKLVGMLMRYDAQSNNADVVPAPVIEHFLKDVAQPPYKGFPRVGISFSSTRDPQFRRYLGLTEQAHGGVYVTEVAPGGPAAKAGLEKGDVLLRVDDQPVDQDGNYADPDYGKIAVGHLFSTRHYIGDTVKFTILRKGENKDLNVVLSRRAAAELCRRALHHRSRRRSSTSSAASSCRSSRASTCESGATTG